MKIPAFKSHQKIFLYGGRNPCWPYILYCTVLYTYYTVLYCILYCIKHFIANPYFEQWQTIFRYVEGVQCVVLRMSSRFLKIEHTGNEFVSFNQDLGATWTTIRFSTCLAGNQQHTGLDNVFLRVSNLIATRLKGEEMRQKPFTLCSILSW